MKCLFRGDDDGGDGGDGDVFVGSTVMVPV